MKVIERNGQEYVWTKFILLKTGTSVNIFKRDNGPF
jgi:hypothetical protein